MKKVLKYMGGLIAVLLVIAQFLPSGRSNPPVTSDLVAPAEVKEVLRRACYDCHSNETQWPLYSKIAPVSWWIVDHIDEGREDLNFSTWDQYSARKQARKITECYEQAADGEMPLTSYTLMHPSAKLSEADLALLREWDEDSDQ